MSKYLVSEQDVKKALRIDSFRNLSKEKVIEFASLIPCMDKDVARDIIAQFPTYAKTAGIMVEHYKMMCNSLLEENRLSQSSAVEKYGKILECLEAQLKKDNLSADDRERIIQDMILVADKIAQKDSENKNFLYELAKCAGGFMLGTLFVGALILGTNMKSSELPMVS